MKKTELFSLTVFEKGEEVIYTLNPPEGKDLNDIGASMIVQHMLSYASSMAKLHNPNKEDFLDVCSDIYDQS